ncbi:MAG TPA: tRNA (adenosine(37)-N6)-dimethylallyltransferase MiaA [Acidimicrobiales bacterium]
MAVSAGAGPAPDATGARGASARLAIVGPTATGKSELGVAVCRRLGAAEVVSADALLVYRGMDIGTAKPSPADRSVVPHHLVDVADPSEDYSLARFVAAGRAALEDIAARGASAVVVGGTGLYVRGLVDRLDVPGQWPAVRADLDAEPDTRALHTRLVQLDPVAASRMEPANRRRVVRALEVTVGSGRPFSSFGPGLDAYPPVATVLVGLDLPIDVLDRRITERVEAMLTAGLLAEVERLASAPGGLSRTAAQGLGYRQLLAHLRGEMTLDEAMGEIVAATRRFARRQRRWFRRDPRIIWFDASAVDAAAVSGLLRDA